MNKLKKIIFSGALILVSILCTQTIIYAANIEGDVNFNGKVNYYDVAFIQLHINKKRILTGKNFTAADVNKDGVVDRKDLLEVNKIRLANITRGDINSDGKINNTDYDMMKAHIEKVKGKTLVRDELIAADLNRDNVIDMNDLKMLSKAITVRGNYLGDVNYDAKIDKKDLFYIKQMIDGKKINAEISYKAADVNKDGKINNADYLIVYYRYQNSFAYGLGDVNQDGKISEADMSIIKQHYTKGRKLTDAQAKRADINRDGKINYTDYVLTYYKMLAQRL